MASDSTIRPAVAAALVALSWSIGAGAQPDDASVAAARAFMAEGRSLRANKDLRAALESFRSADAIMHVPTTGIEVARTQASLGWLLEARKTLEQLLARKVADDEPAQFGAARMAASTLNDELGKRIPTVHISVAGLAPKTRYTVWADGTLLDSAEYDHGLRFNPGKHMLVARAEAAEAKQFFDLEEGQTRSIVLDLGMDAPDVAAPPAKPHPKASVSPMVYVLGATAAVSFGVAGASLLLERRKMDELSQRCAPDCNERDVEPAKNLLEVANVSLVVGAASAATGLIWYLVDKPGDSAPQVSKMRAFPLDAQPTRGGGMMRWTMTF
jgi:hypothetical protein